MKLIKTLSLYLLITTIGVPSAHADWREWANQTHATFSGLYGNVSFNPEYLAVTSIGLGIAAATLGFMYRFGAKKPKPFDKIVASRFEKLPPDMRRHIISYMPAVNDGPGEFKDIALQWSKETPFKEKQRTSAQERRKYGYNGKKIPINSHTLKGNKPCVGNSGYIIENAQPSMLNGLWYADSSAPNTIICVNTSKKTLKAIITNPNNDAIISCSLSKKGDLAIAWKDITNKPHITFTNLAKIKLGEAIDLNQNKIPLTRILKNDNFLLHTFNLNTTLFNRQGNLLACIYKNQASENYTLQYITTSDKEILEA